MQCAYRQTIDGRIIGTVQYALCIQTIDGRINGTVQYAMYIQTIDGRIKGRVQYAMCIPEIRELQISIETYDMRYFPQHVLLCTSHVHDQSVNICIGVFL